MKTKLIVSSLAATAALLAACSSSSGPYVAGAFDVSHVHDVAVEPNGTVLVATHTGLFRLEGVDRAVLVGRDRHDLMAMAAADGELFASGHPDLRRDEYRVAGRPPHLGLVRSTDGGESWEVLDFLGEADFHAIVVRADGIYAVESEGNLHHRGPDGTWSTLGFVERGRDLAIHPEEPQLLLVPDYDGGVWLSDDGGTTFGRWVEAPPLVEVEWLRGGELLGATESGEIWQAPSIEGTWERVASGPAGLETLHVEPDGTWWVAAHRGAISRSTDRGANWVPVYVPPST